MIIVSGAAHVGAAPTVPASRVFGQRRAELAAGPPDIARHDASPVSLPGRKPA